MELIYEEQNSSKYKISTATRLVFVIWRYSEAICSTSAVGVVPLQFSSHTLFQRYVEFLSVILHFGLHAQHHSKFIMKIKCNTKCVYELLHVKIRRILNYICSISISTFYSLPILYILKDFGPLFIDSILIKQAQILN